MGVLSSYLSKLFPLSIIYSASEQNTKWLTDISEFATNKGKIYLSVNINCYNDDIIAYKIGNKPTVAITNDTLLETINKLAKSNIKPIIHSEKRCHYRWPGWIQITTVNGLICFMSKKGYSPDNSACEGFFGRMKTSCIYNHSVDHLSLYEIKNYLNRYISLI